MANGLKKHNQQAAKANTNTVAHQIVVAGEHFSGPLPPPSALKQYEDACQGAANRIIAMAEKEQSHRHAQDSRELKVIASLAALGQIFGFLIGMTGLVAGAFLIWSGKSIQGFGVFLTCLATLVGAYLYAKRQDAKSNSVSTPPTP